MILTKNHLIEGKIIKKGAYINIVEAGNTIRLYRGLEQPFNPRHDTANSDAQYGYTTWTDNVELAKQYAGSNGYVYYIDLPKSAMGKEAIDENPKSLTYGDRYLFFFNDKPASINGVKGK